MSDEDSIPDALFRFKPKKKWKMPSAEELAEERERELRCDLELRQLIASMAGESGCSVSGEGEAVEAQVSCAPMRRAEAPSVSQLLQALSPRVPDEARALLTYPGALGEAVRGAVALVARDGEGWTRAEVLGVGALLAVAVLGQDAPRVDRMLALRALHTLLECRATASQALELVCSLVEALPSPRDCLQLCDVLRGGGAPRTDHLADVALDAALATLLAVKRAPHAALTMDSVVEAMEAQWCRLSATDAYLVLQLVGRRLAAPRPHEGEASLRLLRVLHTAARATSGAAPAHCAELTLSLLRVNVAANRLTRFFSVSD